MVTRAPDTRVTGHARAATSRVLVATVVDDVELS